MLLLSFHLQHFQATYQVYDSHRHITFLLEVPSSPLALETSQTGKEEKTTTVNQTLFGDLLPLESILPFSLDEFNKQAFQSKAGSSSDGESTEQAQKQTKNPVTFMGTIQTTIYDTELSLLQSEDFIASKKSMIKEQIAVDTSMQFFTESFAPLFSFSSLSFYRSISQSSPMKSEVFYAINKPISFITIQETIYDSYEIPKYKELPTFPVSTAILQYLYDKERACSIMNDDVNSQLETLYESYMKSQSMTSVEKDDRSISELRKLLKSTNLEGSDLVYDSLVYLRKLAIASSVLYHNRKLLSMNEEETDSNKILDDVLYEISVERELDAIMENSLEELDLSIQSIPRKKEAEYKNVNKKNSDFSSSFQDMFRGIFDTEKKDKMKEMERLKREEEERLKVEEERLRREEEEERLKREEEERLRKEEERLRREEEERLRKEEAERLREEEERLRKEEAERLRRDIMRVLEEEERLKKEEEEQLRKEEERKKKQEEKKRQEEEKKRQEEERLRKEERRLQLEQERLLNMNWEKRLGLIINKLIEQTLQPVKNKYRKINIIKHSRISYNMRHSKRAFFLRDKGQRLRLEYNKLKAQLNDNMDKLRIRIRNLFIWEMNNDNRLKQIYTVSNLTEDEIDLLFFIANNVVEDEIHRLNREKQFEHSFYLQQREYLYALGIYDHPDYEGTSVSRFEIEITSLTTNTFSHIYHPQEYSSHFMVSQSHTDFTSSVVACSGESITGANTCPTPNTDISLYQTILDLQTIPSILFYSILNLSR